jgi:hypothetical protein
VNIYYEIHPIADVSAVKYLMATMGTGYEPVMLTAMALSTRVWQEDERGVICIKDRFNDLYDTGGVVDMKEFMWIKLQAMQMP